MSASPPTPESRARDGESAASTFDDLKIPDMSPRSLLRQFGPGMILMMTGIGTSHLVPARPAGQQSQVLLPDRA